MIILLYTTTRLSINQLAINIMWNTVSAKSHLPYICDGILIFIEDIEKKNRFFIVDIVKKLILKSIL